MLVIVSDLHLTDGSSGTTIKADAFRILRNQLRTLAYAASWAKNGTYKPIEEIDLVLLGDGLDVIRSWSYSGSPSAVMPWSDTSSSGFAQRVGQITNAIMTHNTEGLAILKSMSSGEGVTVPLEALPTQLSEREYYARLASVPRNPVKVRIHYQVGNHDWFYHLRGPAFDAIRQGVVDTMGLANDPKEPFPHCPTESSCLQQVYRKHRVLAKHGDEYDRFNYEGKRDASSLGDAIVVMLINRFADEVKNWLTDPSLGTCVSGLREVDNVRPILMIPVWINSLLNRTCTQSQAEVVKRVWDSLVDEFLNIPFVRERKSFWNCFNSVNELEWGLKFSQGVRIQTLSSVVESVRSWMHADDGSLAQKAFQDATSLSQAVDFIVCGHTHQFEIVPLQATIPRSQIYVNSGTWRRVYEEAQGQPGKHEFVGQDVMAYVALYAEHERSGRPFETWSGSLGPPVI